ncbi:PP2C family protein-serine/threonine phosphatase, partial [Parenemella sanctibonifatiensis]
MHLNFTCHSEVGLVRKNNQDSGYASATMLVVADGMGGAAAGDLASAVAVQELSRSDERMADAPATGEDMLEAMAGAISRANDRIADLVADDHSLDGMGTTVCGVMFDGSQIGLAHIGDSRGYLLRDGELTQLSHDHSWVQSLVDQGKLTDEEAAVNPHRSLLLKVLNGQPGNEPDLELLDVREGDRLLFCSDGLCGLVDNDVIAELLAEGDVETATDALAEAARAAGGIDNITVVVADVVPEDPELAPIKAGAAATTTVPVVEPRTISIESNRPSDDDGTSAIIPAAPKPKGYQEATEEDDDEDERYRPRLGGWFSRIMWGLGTAVVIAGLVLGGFYGGRWYLDQQYYVGAEGDQVAIYQGVPGSFAGIQFSHVHTPQDILVTDLSPYYQQRVGESIRVPDLVTAQETVSVLRENATFCKAQREAANQPPEPE